MHREDGSLKKIIVIIMINNHDNSPLGKVPSETCGDGNTEGAEGPLCNVGSVPLCVPGPLPSGCGRRPHGVRSASSATGRCQRSHFVRFIFFLLSFFPSFFPSFPLSFLLSFFLSICSSFRGRPAGGRGIQFEIEIKIQIQIQILYIFFVLFS